MKKYKTAESNNAQLTGSITFNPVVNWQVFTSKIEAKTTEDIIKELKYIIRQMKRHPIEANCGSCNLPELKSEWSNLSR